MSDTSAHIYDLIEVRNIADTELVLNGNTRYIIPAGGKRIIPFAEAASWFGDPRLSDDGRNRFRSEAFRMTQNLWGYTEGMKYLRDRWDPSQGFLTWEDFKPKVQCFDMDGNEMLFLIHDPDGTRGTFAGPALVDPSALDASALQRQVAELSKQLLAVQAALLERSQYDVAVPVIPETPGPAPVAVPAAVQAAAAANAQLEADDLGAAVNLPQPPVDDVVGDDAPRTVKGGRSK